jgi:hypothetical protein
VHALQSHLDAHALHVSSDLASSDAKRAATELLEAMCIESKEIITAMRKHAPAHSHPPAGTHASTAPLTAHQCMRVLEQQLQSQLRTDEVAMRARGFVVASSNI